MQCNVHKATNCWGKCWSCVNLFFLNTIFFVVLRFRMYIYVHTGVHASNRKFYYWELRVDVKWNVSLYCTTHKQLITVYCMSWKELSTYTHTYLYIENGWKHVCFFLERNEYENSRQQQLNVRMCGCISEL